MFLEVIYCHDRSFNCLSTQRQISDFFGIWCVSLVEVTINNFRLFFLIETDL